MRPNKDRQNLWLWAALLLPLLWLAAGLAQITEQAHGLSALAAGLTALLNDPLSLRWCSSTPKFLLAVLVLYPLGVYCYLLDQADRRPGEEHGSAHWGIAKSPFGFTITSRATATARTRGRKSFFPRISASAMIPTNTSAICTLL